MFALAKRARIAAFVSVLIFVACKADSGQTDQLPTPGVSPSDATPAGLEDSTSNLPTRIPPVSTTQAPLTGILPEYSETIFDTGLVVSENSVSVCDPPCWQGLTIGISSEDDLARFVESGLGFVDYAYFATYPVVETASLSTDALEGFHVLGTGWPVDNDLRQVYFYAWLESRTGTVEGLQVTWFGSHKDTFIADAPSIHTILEQLGTPMAILVKVDERAVELGLFQDSFSPQTVLLYDYGWSFELTSTYIRVTENQVPLFCLGENARSGHFTVTHPFTSTENMTAIQDHLVGRFIRSQEMRSFEEVFAITPARLHELAISSEELCFPIPTR